MRKITGIYFLLSSFCFFCNAQQTVSTAGIEATGSGGTVSYSIGQVAYTTNTGSDGTVSQGVQLPYEISAMPTGEDKYGINPELSVYPNPAKDYLLLKVKNYTNLSYNLYDMNGKLIQNKELECCRDHYSNEKSSQICLFSKGN